MEPELEISPSLQLLWKIGEIRSSVSKLAVKQQDIMEQLQKDIEIRIQATAAYLEKDNIVQAQEEISKAQKLYMQFEQAVQCIINTQKGSRTGQIQSKL